MECIESVCAKKIVTRDLGGNSNTKEVTSAVCEEIKQAYAGKQKSAA